MCEPVGGGGGGGETAGREGAVCRAGGGVGKDSEREDKGPSRSSGWKAHGNVGPKKGGDSPKSHGYG